MPSTLYGRVATTYTVSTASTYSNPVLSRSVEPYTSAAITQHMHEIFDAATGGGTDKTFDGFASIAMATFKNQDLVNYVDISGTGAVGAFAQRVPAGKLITLSDVPVGTAINFTASTGAVSIEALIVGT